MSDKVDAEVVKNAMSMLTDIRRSQLEAMLPFSLVFGFDVLLSGVVKSPTILLPSEDYIVFEALYNGPEGDAVRAMTSAAAPAQPPKGAASDAGDLASPLPPSSEVPGK